MGEISDLVIDMSETDTQFLGIIGSRKYPMNKETHVHYLTYMLGRVMGSDGEVEDHHVVVSGHCLNSPDMWAEIFAERFGLFSKIFPASEFGNDYFLRNWFVADYSDSLVAFIPRGQVKSGAWNTISQFLDMGKTDVLVLDENGESWMQQWAQDKLDRNLAREGQMPASTIQTSLVS